MYLNSWLLHDGDSAEFKSVRTEKELFKCLVSNDIILRDYGRITIGKPLPLAFGANTVVSPHTRLFWWLLKHSRFLCEETSCDIDELFERAADYCTVTSVMLKSLGCNYSVDYLDIIFEVWLPRILPATPTHSVAAYYRWLLPRNWTPDSKDHISFEKHAPYTADRLKTLRCKRIPYCYTLPGEFCIHAAGNLEIKRFASTLGYGYVVARLLCYSTQRNYTLARSLIALFGPGDIPCMFKHFCEISRMVRWYRLGSVMVNLFDDRCDMVAMLEKYECHPLTFMFMMGTRTPTDVIKSHVELNIRLYLEGEIQEWKLRQILRYPSITKEIISEVIDEMGVRCEVDFLLK